MSQFFADTFYWGALFNRRDQWHDEALSFSRSLTMGDQVLCTFVRKYPLSASLKGLGQYRDEFSFRDRF